MKSFLSFGCVLSPIGLIKVWSKSKLAILFFLYVLSVSSEYKIDPLIFHFIVIFNKDR